jgi:DNA-binding NarL/FixJ family response regulator
MALTTVIIDDHPVVVEGIRSWIARDPACRVAIVHTGTELADLRDEAALAADVIVLDLELKEGLVVDAIPALSAVGRRVVAFSQHRDPELILRVIEAGASAYVTKDEAEEHLVETIVAAAHDRPYVTRSQAKGMLADLRPSRPKLSTRERQALVTRWAGPVDLGQRRALRCRRTAPAVRRQSGDLRPWRDLVLERHRRWRLPAEGAERRKRRRLQRRQRCGAVGHRDGRTHLGGG